MHAGSATNGQDRVHALAVSPAYAQDGVCFAACVSGLRRSQDAGLTWHDAYRRLNLQTPLATAAVAVSPHFAQDRTVFAGALGGILRSVDGGDTWSVTSLPSPPPFVVAIAVSPTYEEDGLVFAATLEDGVFRSWDRGASWAAWNFGLLDLGVYCLAISPDFGRDETIYAGVESGIFRSTNGGRAWREAAFPMQMAPVLSLAVASTDPALIFAGTEAHGIYRSGDGGATWSALGGAPSLDAIDPINDLWPAPAFPAEPTLVAHAGSGLVISRDGGDAWRALPLSDPAAGAISCISIPSAMDAGAPLLAGTDDGRVLALRFPAAA